MRKLVFITLVGTFSLFAQEETAVLRLQGMDGVDVKKDIRYDGELTFDLYRPATIANALPLVVFLNGVGRPDLKEWGQYTSWPRLLALRGIAAVTYQTSGNDVAAQTDALFKHLREHAVQWKIDPARIGVWACSANVRLGTSLLANHSYRAAVLYYGLMETAPKNINTPVYVARAGLDALTLNESIDRWVTQAIAIDVPLTLVTYPEGRHAFDVLDNTPESRKIIEETLDFLQFHLTTTPTPRRQPMTLSQLQRVIRDEGIDRAIARLTDVRKKEPAAFVVQEASLNSLGYSLLEESVADAVKVLELVAATHPDSPNAHDSLGDAYEAAGRAQDAIREAERALQLLDNAPPPRRDAIRRSAEEKLARLKK